MPRKSSARTALIESHFTQDGEAYKCSHCDAKVKCMERRGAPGRTSHLTKVHPEKLKEILTESGKTEKEEREIKDEEKPEIATQPAKKKCRGEKGITQEGAVDFIARRLEPFACASDPLFGGLISRKTIGSQLQTRAATLFDEFKNANKKKSLSVCIDSGTNNAVTKADWLCEAQGLHNSHHLRLPQGVAYRTRA